MPAYRYDDIDTSRGAGTIARLLQQRGDAQADLALRLGDISSRATERSGQAWAGAAQSIGQDLAAVPGQIQKSQDDALRRRSTLTEVEQRERANAAAKALSETMRETPPIASNGTKLTDVQAIADKMTAKGFGAEMGPAAQHLEGLNQSFQTFRQGQLAVVQKGAAAVAAAGNHPDLAEDFLNQVEDNAVYPKETVQKYRDFIRADPANVKKLTAYLMGPPQTEVVPQGGTVVNKVTNEPLFTNPEKKPLPTRASLAATANDPSKTPEERAAAAKSLTDMTPQPRRTDTEMALDAYAKSIGKEKAEDLTHGDRQVYERERAKFTTDAQFQQHMRERQYDNAHPAPVKATDQNKLEQEARTVLARGLSSRSGGLGAEDAKVQQANHLTALMDQFYDPKTGDYNIPRVQLNELALGLARLTAPGGTAGVEMLKEFQQRTAKGDVAGALSYLTGQPISANTQSITRMLKESIERQGATAQTNREGEMAYLRGLMPTELAEERRKALEATSLNPLRLSREIRNTSTGERKLQVSTDGGVTWK